MHLVSGETFTDSLSHTYAHTSSSITDERAVTAADNHILLVSYTV